MPKGRNSGLFWSSSKMFCFCSCLFVYNRKLWSYILHANKIAPFDTRMTKMTNLKEKQIKLATAAIADLKELVAQTGNLLMNLSKSGVEATAKAVCNFYNEASPIQQDCLDIAYCWCGSWDSENEAREALEAVKGNAIKALAWKQNRLEVFECERPEYRQGITIYEVVRVSTKRGEPLSTHTNYFSSKERVKAFLNKKYDFYAPDMEENSKFKCIERSDYSLQFYQEDEEYLIEFHMNHVDVE